MSGLTVEAYASRGDGTHTIASTVTESRGRFILEVSAAALRSAFGSDVPPLDLRVRDKGEVYRSTSGATRWDARRSGSGTIEIDKAVAYPAAVGQRWFVEGTVSNPDGTTPPGITVEVWGQKIARFGVEEESLGSTSLSASGEFHVAFIEGPTTRRIRVAARDGSGEVASRQLDTPTPRTRVHLVVGAPNIARDRGLTVHAHVRSRIDPLLADVGASLDALTADQISLLAAQARVPRASVERAVNRPAPIRGQSIYAAIASYSRIGLPSMNLFSNSTGLR